jgi:g-D-glutamyl-meso-diaminopimelate peptidase
MCKKTFLMILCILAAFLAGCDGIFVTTVPITPATAKLFPSKSAHSGTPSPVPIVILTESPTMEPSSASPTPKASPSPPPSPAPMNLKYKVQCSEYLTLRKSPSLSAEELGRVKKGAQVTVTGFDGLFARVTDSAGRAGYVLAGYLVPVKKDKWLTGLNVVKPAQNYSYNQMIGDLQSLAARYSGRLTLESAGTTLLGRDIPVAVLGDPDAPRQALLQGCIHGREHMTCLLMMAQLEYCLKYADAPFGDGTVGQCLDGVCLRFLPMADPDGVTISQKAAMTEPLRAIYNSDKALKYTSLSAMKYLKEWKANAAGVDINRNFPAGWEELDTRGGPSSSHYKGAQSADQPETRALMDYTQRYRFDATVSYHAQGSALYWQYGEDVEANARSLGLANAVKACTQYPLQGSDGLDAGGYKDWATAALGIPSITVEIGGRDCPLPLDEFYSIWERNRNVPAAVAQWVKDN